MALLPAESNFWPRRRAHREVLAAREATPRGDTSLASSSKKTAASQECSPSDSDTPDVGRSQSPSTALIGP
jgi:hypothetical protein